MWCKVHVDRTAGKYVRKIGQKEYNFSKPLSAANAILATHAEYQKQRRAFFVPEARCSRGAEPRSSALIFAVHEVGAAEGRSPEAAPGFCSA